MAIIEAYTAEENEAIEELRRRLADDMKADLYDDTHMFYRFLKARDFNIDAAEIMLRKHLAWRKERKVDTIQTYKSPEALEKYFIGNPICLSKEGLPVRYAALGRMDPKGVRRSAKFYDIIQFSIKNIENEMDILAQQKKKYGYELPGSIFIIDLKDISFAMASDKKTLEHIIYFAKMYQDNYPERLKKIFLINLSPYFSFAYNIIKHVLTASVIEKIEFLGSETYKEELLKVIDANELPAFLGGNRTDPDGDPMCKSFVCHSGPIPEKYFINKEKAPLRLEKGVKKLVLSRASFSEVELEVRKAGCLIEWEFETKCRDIAFGLFFKDEDDSMVELVPLQRLDTEDFSEAGVHKCEKTGTYIILFDNSYSWIRSKEIYYRAKVTSPNELEKEDID